MSSVLYLLRQAFLFCIGFSMIISSPGRSGGLAYKRSEHLIDCLLSLDRFFPSPRSQTNDGETALMIHINKQNSLPIMISGETSSKVKCERCFSDTTLEIDDTYAFCHCLRYL